MSHDRGISYSLIIAVREGRLEEARKLINSYGLSYAPGWSDGYCLLLEAVKKGNTAMVQLLLTNNAKVNSKRNNMQTSDTPLHHAVQNYNTEMIEMLIDKGANVNAKNQCGDTPLHIATKNKNEIIVKLLLKRDSEANERNNNGEAPLHIACARGYLEIVETLFYHGAAINLPAYGKFRSLYTALHFAVQGNHEKIVNLLLMRKANVNASAELGTTPLHVAAGNGNVQIAKELLNHGAITDVYSGAEGYTPLHIAAQSGKGEVVRLLLENGATVDVLSKNEMTVLQLAVDKGYLNIVKDILKQCPDMNIQSNRKSLNNAIIQSQRYNFKEIVEYFLHYGVTIGSEEANNPELMHAAVEKGYLKVVEDLLKYGADANILHSSTYKEGCTPLHTAAANSQADVTKLLIIHGANVNAKDKSERTPLFYAIKNKNLHLAQVLLGNGADLKKNTELLSIAVALQCKEIVEILLQHDLDINAYDEFGITALHCTLQSTNNYNNPDEQCEMAKLLLSKGANVNAKTIKGVTTLHVAAYKGYSEIVQALLDYNADVNCAQERDMTPFHLFSHKIYNELPMGSFLNNSRYGKFTPLHYACFRGHEQVVKVLLEHGAESSPKDKEQLIPLHIAAQNGFGKIVEILLSFSADIDIDSRDVEGRTALHYAFKGEHEYTINALLRNGADINIFCKNNFLPFSYYPCRTQLLRQIRHNRIPAIIQIFIQHIVQLKTAGLYINEENLQHLKHFNYTNISSIYEAELEIMRNEKINNSKISFHDILTNSIHQVANYLRNKNIPEALKCDDYKEKFPKYAGLLKSQIRKGMERKLLMQQGTTLFDSFFENFPTLPLHCTEKILNYLNIKDLRAFIDV